MSKRTRLSEGCYPLKWRVFQTVDTTYMIQPMYWQRLVQLKPFKHISKLYKIDEGEYLFDIKEGSEKVHYTLKITWGQVCVDKMKQAETLATS